MILWRVFRHFEVKSFRQKIVILAAIPYPRLSIQIFDTRNFLEQRRFFFEVFRFSETTKFHWKIVIFPRIHKSFSIPEVFRNTARSSYESLSTVRQKVSTEKSWYSLPSASSWLIHKFIRTRSFRKHRSLPLRCFPSSETKKNLSVKRDTSSIPTLSPTKFSDRWRYLKNEVFAWELFQYCEAKKFRQKIVLLPPSQLSYS